MSKNTTRTKHFLFFTRTKQNVDAYFKFCNIRFDSNVVVYYALNKTKSLSFIYFEEIYKIKEKKHEKLERKSLGKLNLNSKIFSLIGLKSNIWRRRRNLHGVVFNSITEIIAPYVNNIKTSDRSNKNVVAQQTGYYSDIMTHLMANLNFTLNTRLPQKRNSWSEMVKTVSDGNYDIGYTYFTFTRARKDVVDFSYGISTLSHSLFYEKNHEVLNFKIFS